jgi:hypothetical protein
MCWYVLNIHIPISTICRSEPVVELGNAGEGTSSWRASVCEDHV